MLVRRSDGARVVVLNGHLLEFSRGLDAECRFGETQIITRACDASSNCDPNQDPNELRKTSKTAPGYYRKMHGSTIALSIEKCKILFALLVIIPALGNIDLLRGKSRFARTATGTARGRLVSVSEPLNKRAIARFERLPGPNCFGVLATGPDLDRTSVRLR